MFDFDAGKLLIVGVIALIFIPPKDLPRVLRQVGQFVGKMRRMASEFQGQFMDAMREADMADLRQEARKLADAARIDVGAGSVSDLKDHLAGAIEGKPVMVDLATAEAPTGQSPLVDPNPELRRLVGGNGAAPAAELTHHAGPSGGDAGRGEEARPARALPVSVRSAPVVPEPAMSEPPAGTTSAASRSA